MRPFVPGIRTAALLATAAAAVAALMTVSPAGAQVDGDAEAVPIAPTDDLPDPPVEADLPPAPDPELPADPELPPGSELPPTPELPTSPPVQLPPNGDLGPFVPDRLVASPPAPNCVDVFYQSHYTHKEVHLHNQCNGRIRVKVLVAFGPDSQCYNLLMGETQTYRWFVGWPYFASRFDGLVHC